MGDLFKNDKTTFIKNEYQSEFLNNSKALSEDEKKDPDNCNLERQKKLLYIQDHESRLDFLTKLMCLIMV